MPTPKSSSVSRHQQFASTHWSIVLDAGRDSSPTSEQALSTLCETYWYPLYAFVRRQGYESSDAQDLTQGFFLRLLEKRDFANVDRQKGRFRSFLLASLKHYLINEWDKARAAKRGGGRPNLPLEFDAAERRYSLEPCHEQTPEAIFDREWALTVLEQVRSQLVAEHASDDRRDQYDQLHLYLTGEPTSLSYREAGEQLDMTEGAVKVAVHRLRRRFRELLREQIGQTVATESVIDDEVAALFKALRSRPS
ncbi:MAG: RNA polymerase sigma factor [Pirellulaceae bacterium]